MSCLHEASCWFRFYHSQPFSHSSFNSSSSHHTHSLSPIQLFSAVARSRITSLNLTGCRFSLTDAIAQSKLRPSPYPHICLNAISLKEFRGIRPSPDLYPLLSVLFSFCVSVFSLIVFSSLLSFLSSSLLHRRHRQKPASAVIYWSFIHYIRDIGSSTATHVCRRAISSGHVQINWPISGRQ